MRTFLVVLSLVLLPFTALADTFTIEDGTVFSTTGTLSFNVSGQDFSARGGDTPTPLGGSATPGQMFSSTNRLFLAGGNYLFNGVVFNPSESGSQWTLTTTALIPAGFTGGTVQGTAGVLGLVSLQNETTPRHTIVGTGQATLQFNPTVGTFTEFRRVDVSFEASSPIGNIPNGGAPSAVPEPGTWLLLATGLGGLALYRRRQV